MLFQQRHYKKIADTINLVPEPERSLARMLIDSLCKMFEQDNPNFKADLFLRNVERDD